MEYEFHDSMAVELEPHVDMADSPTGPAPVEHNQYRVLVRSAALTDRPNNRLQVGWIGKQAGANFCPISAFYKFHFPQQQWIAAQARKLHGSAASGDHVDVPPPDMDYST